MANRKLFKYEKESTNIDDKKIKKIENKLTQVPTVLKTLTGFPKGEELIQYGLTMTQLNMLVDLDNKCKNTSSKLGDVKVEYEVQKRINGIVGEKEAEFNKQMKAKEEEFNKQIEELKHSNSINADEFAIIENLSRLKEKYDFGKYGEQTISDKDHSLKSCLWIIENEYDDSKEVSKVLSSLEYHLNNYWADEYTIPCLFKEKTDPLIYELCNETQTTLQYVADLLYSVQYKAYSILLESSSLLRDFKEDFATLKLDMAINVEYKWCREGLYDSVEYTPEEEEFLERYDTFMRLKTDEERTALKNICERINIDVPDCPSYLWLVDKIFSNIYGYEDVV